MNRKLATLSVILLSGCLLSLPAQAQTSCANASLSGTYFYLFGGSLLVSGSASPYAELGEFVADGNGRLSGHSRASVNGSISPYTFTGTYALHGDCTGTLSINFSNSSPGEIFYFQLVEEGQSAVIVFSTPNEVVVGRAYRAAGPGAGRCANTSFSGTYGYSFSGVMVLGGSNFFYSNAGQAVSNGSGGMTTSGVGNVGSGAFPSNATGTYSIAGDCSGTAQLINENGTANYIVAVVEGGKTLFMETDAGATIAGTVDPQLIQSVLPQFCFRRSLVFGALFHEYDRRRGVVLRELH
jgi:hypothetical protein